MHLHNRNRNRTVPLSLNLFDIMLIHIAPCHYGSSRPRSDSSTSQSSLPSTKPKPILSRSASWKVEHVMRTFRPRLHTRRTTDNASPFQSQLDVSRYPNTSRSSIWETFDGGDDEADLEQHQLGAQPKSLADVSWLSISFRSTKLTIILQRLPLLCASTISSSSDGVSAHTLTLSELGDGAIPSEDEEAYSESQISFMPPRSTECSYTDRETCSSHYPTSMSEDEEDDASDEDYVFRMEPNGKMRERRATPMNVFNRTRRWVRRVSLRS